MSETSPDKTRSARGGRRGVPEGSGSDTGSGEAAGEAAAAGTELAGRAPLGAFL